MQNIPELHSDLTFNKAAPKSLLFVGLILVILSGLLSSGVMIKLGPMRTSLLSDNDWVQHVAEQELLFGRILLALAGIAMVAVWFFWGAVISSKFILYIAHHNPDRLSLKQSSFPAFTMIGGGVLLILVWVAATGYFPDLMNYAIIAEDGLIEYATAFLFLAAAIVSLQLSLKLPKKRKKTVHTLLAIGFFLCFGEEISWGQRIFSFDTPLLLQTINTQNELNIHNSFGYLADHIFIAGVFLYGAIIPLIAHNNRFIQRIFDTSGLPLASVGLALGFLVVSFLHDWTVYAAFPRTPLRIAETRELLSALCFLLLMIENRRYLPKLTSLG